MGSQYVSGTGNYFGSQATPRRSVPIGEMNKKIMLVSHRLKSPFMGAEENMEVDYTNEKEVWAKVVTVKPRKSFNGVTLTPAPTHHFFIRYREDVSTEWSVVYKDERYSIDDLQTYDEDKNFMVLYCGKLGDDAVEVQATWG